MTVVMDRERFPCDGSDSNEMFPVGGEVEVVDSEREDVGWLADLGAGGVLRGRREGGKGQFGEKGEGRRRREEKRTNVSIDLPIVDGAEEP